MLLAACNKDNPGSILPGTSNYRITEWVVSEDGKLDMKVTVTYEGKKVKEILEYDYTMKDQWRLSNKYELTYPEANKAINKSFLFNPSDSTWKEDFMYEFTYEGEKTIEYIFSLRNNFEWHPVHKRNATYENNLLTQDLYYELAAGGWEEDLKYTYHYMNEDINHIETFNWHEDSWALSAERFYEYSGGQLDWVKTHMGVQGIWDTVKKIKLNYNGQLLDIADFYNKNISGWTHHSSINYAYDSYGNLKSWETNYIQQQSTTRMEFKYQAGTGNFADVMVTSINSPLNWWHPFPTASAMDRCTNESDKLQLTNVQ